jgi:adenylate cyclase
MAVEMRDCIGDLTAKWRMLGHELGFGVGIAHGFATLGCVGFEGRFQYSATGTVANLAARLCDEAASGQILVDAKVHHAVASIVDLEPAGELVLKGLRRPVRAFNVRALRSQRSAGARKPVGAAAAARCPGDRRIGIG